MIEAGRVTVNGRTCRDPERPTILGRDRLQVDGRDVQAADKVYLMLNKPRGLVTTTADEQGRATVYECLREAGLPPLSPVGRLDRASEGLLFFTNDHTWAARMTDPGARVEKAYHVHIDRVADDKLCHLLQLGGAHDGDHLSVSRAAVLRRSKSTSWLELVLHEGRNRQIRRLLGLFNINVLRLIRVRIGHLQLGNLAKGQYRHLSRSEVSGYALCDADESPPARAEKKKPEERRRP